MRKEAAEGWLQAVKHLILSFRHHGIWPIVAGPQPLRPRWEWSTLMQDGKGLVRSSRVVDLKNAGVQPVIRGAERAELEI